MSEFTSNFGQQMEEMLALRVSMGRSPQTHRDILLNFDRFCKQKFPDEKVLTQEIVLRWMEKRPKEKVGGLQARAVAI